MTVNDKNIMLGLKKAAYYQDSVLSGDIPAGKYTRLAVERNVRDAAEADSKGFYFDARAAGRAIAIYSYLRHVKGAMSGKQIDLEPWQCWIVAVVFGWKWKNTGKRRFRKVYEEVGRKNGKTTKLCGIAVLGLLKDDEGGPEIYSCATKRDQAALMFKATCHMVNQSPQLKKRLTVPTGEKGTMYSPSNMGLFAPLSSDASTLDGLNPHFALVDEIHAHKDSTVWDVMLSAFGARSQPLLWGITTAGFNQDGFCFEYRENYVKRVLDCDITDESLFGIIYTIDDGDRWDDEKNWIKANPNIGVSVDLNYLRNMAAEAAVLPYQHVNFLTKHLNVWVNGALNWCNTDKWDKCAGSYTLESLFEAENVYGGLDLGSVSDITSLGLIAEMPDGSIRTWCLNYLPEARANDTNEKNSTKYKEWAKKGWLTLTSGDVCDYKTIKSDIIRLTEKMPIRSIGFDRWNSSQLVNELQEINEDLMIQFGQGFASMNAPMKEIERLYLSSSLTHPNDPVLNFAMKNVVISQDPAGNIKPDKKRAREKIDPAVAIIMAMGRMMLSDKKQHAYIDRGLTTL